MQTVFQLLKIISDLTHTNSISKLMCDVGRWHEAEAARQVWDTESSANSAAQAPTKSPRTHRVTCEVRHSSILATLQINEMNCYHTHSNSSRIPNAVEISNDLFIGTNMQPSAIHTWQLHARTIGALEPSCEPLKPVSYHVVYRGS